MRAAVLAALPLLPSAHVISALANPGGLLAAQQKVRELIRTRPTEDIIVKVQPGVHLLHSPLNFGPQDSGEQGRFRVVWSAAAGTASYDGGVTIEGPWKLDEQLNGSKLWSAALPTKLYNVSIRQIYSSGTRLSRTHSSACDLGFPPSLSKGATVPPPGCGKTVSSARQTANGFKITLDKTQLGWRDVSSVEIVSDHTWVQHRCPVNMVTALPIPPPSPPPAPAPPATCHWGPKLTGHSPGSSLKKMPASTYQACQAACCAALPKCEGIIFNTETCYLLDRKFEHNFVPGGGFVSDLNCSSGAQPVCAPPEPPPVYRSIIHISNGCWTVATQPGALSLTAGAVAGFENTGRFSGAPGEFYIDKSTNRVLVSSEVAPTQVVAGVTQTLMQIEGAQHIEWHNLTFTHSGWEQPSTIGMVERYGGVLFKLPQQASVTNSSLIPSPAAVMVANSSDVSFHACSFARLGAWGLRLYDGTQRASVRRCRFADLSGGGICIGNVNDTGEARPERQMAEIVVEDNTLTDLGAEFPGSGGIHSFCMRQSSVSHNRIRGVGYSGLSYNWPLPQGPTFGPPHDGDAKIGYSRDNTVNGNDVSEYMRYMYDGGGIHTIGRSLNTSVSRNYFHSLASGGSCPCASAAMCPCHSALSQSTIYIDNWSAGFTISENVVVNTSHSSYGWLFFQYFGGKGGDDGAAHDNTASSNTICNAGPVPPPRDPYDEVAGVNVTGTVNATVSAGDSCSNLPQLAKDVIQAAGPRPVMQ